MKSIWMATFNHLRFMGIATYKDNEVIYFEIKLTEMITGRVLYDNDVRTITRDQITPSKLTNDMEILIAFQTCISIVMTTHLNNLLMNVHQYNR